MLSRHTCLGFISSNDLGSETSTISGYIEIVFHLCISSDDKALIDLLDIKRLILALSLRET